MVTEWWPEVVRKLRALDLARQVPTALAKIFESVSVPGSPHQNRVTPRLPLSAQSY